MIVVIDEEEAKLEISNNETANYSFIDLSLTAKHSNTTIQITVDIDELDAAISGLKKQRNLQYQKEKHLP